MYCILTVVAILICSSHRNNTSTGYSDAFNSSYYVGTPALKISANTDSVSIFSYCITRNKNIENVMLVGLDNNTFSCLG